MAQSTVFTPQEIGPAIEKLERRLRDAEAIKPAADFEDAARSVVTRHNDTLAQLFSRDSAQFRRARIQTSDFVVLSARASVPVREPIDAFAKGKKGAISKLKDEIDILKEMLADWQNDTGDLGPQRMVPNATHGVTSSAPAQLSIAPTIYESDQVFVANSITINIQSADFSEFRKALEDTLVALRGSNDFSQEEKHQLASEVKAGAEILSAPKPNRDLVQLLLIRPLKYIGGKVANAAVGIAATHALKMLAKLIGVDLL